MFESLDLEQTRIRFDPYKPYIRCRFSGLLAPPQEVLLYTMQSSHRAGLGAPRHQYQQPGHPRKTNMYNHNNNDEANEHDYEHPQPPMHFHVPPQGHGPAPHPRFTAAPTFVPAQGRYDSQGRLIEDTFTDTDGIRKEGEEKGKTGREGVMDFWKGLDFGVGAVASGSGSGSRSGSPSMRESATVSLPTQNRSSSRLPISSKKLATVTEPKNLVVPRSEWFIRKALLAKARKEAEAKALDEAEARVKAEGGLEAEQEREGRGEEEVKREDEDGDRTGGPSGSVPRLSISKSTLASASASTSNQRPNSSSLASLLNLPPPGTAPSAPPTHFHIRPDNVGWRLLQKGGWSGTGGLGRPEGWEDARDRVKLEEGERLRVKRELNHEENGEGDGQAGKEAEVIDVDAVIDLTELDEDDDHEVRPIDVDAEDAGTSRFGEQELVLADLAERSASSLDNLVGPGRVAPVATYLKNDLAGIGHVPQHRRTILKPHTQTSGQAGAKSEARRKKVTHTLADIRAMQRGKVVPGLSEEDLEKRRRGRAKREANRDREERKRWMQVISA
jgi:hypothetical protein